MNRPYIICHMMMSADGRIDCGMTSKLPGEEEYYAALDGLNLTAALSGKVTAQLEMAEGIFAGGGEPLNRKTYSKKTDAKKYEIVADTKGSLLWQKDRSIPLIVITSEAVSKEYLAYLDEREISWIACGKETIDLAGAMEILAENFHIKRLGIVGGGTVNAGFLNAGLLDEISILIAPGIDGRKGMTSVFDGLPAENEPIPLELKKVTQYENGTVRLQYRIK